jgi:hypothetical protein
MPPSSPTATPGRVFFVEALMQIPIESFQKTPAAAGVFF